RRPLGNHQHWMYRRHFFHWKHAPLRGVAWRLAVSADEIEACRRCWRRRWKKSSQDAIASQILASLADEDAWKKRFAEKRDVIRRMAREALEEDERGKTLPLDDLL